MSETDKYIEENYIGKYCIVRCYVSGVHCGILKMYDTQTRHAIIENSRGIWSWSGRFTLYEISEEGLDKAKLTIIKNEIIVTDVVQVFPASEKAIEKIKDMSAYVPEGC